MTLTDGEYVSVRINAGPKLPDESEPLDGEYPLFYKTVSDEQGYLGLYGATVTGEWIKIGKKTDYAESEGQSDTNLTAWQNKLTYTIQEDGEFLVWWTFELVGTSTSYHALSQVLHNVTEIAGLSFEPEDISPAPWTSGAGFRKLTAAAGDTIKIDWRSENAAGTASIRRAAIFLLRLG